VFTQVFFPSGLPPWNLIFYPVETNMFSSFFQTGQGIFFYIFIIIILILAAGLFFILKAVNNEINLSKMKSQFITTVSHEFKSPLASIRQMGEMLEQNRVPTKERKQKYYQGIVQQSERLTHLIENILNYSKMEAKQKEFRFQKADIELLLKDVVASFENFVSVNGFQIEYEKIGMVPEFYYDPEAMEQVFHNLLDNACKYSGTSKKVKVTLQKKDDDVMINVTDYGVGINKEDRDKIFSRFYRVGDELTQHVKGSGIGLTIVKQIVDAHNGKVVVESEPGKGSTFSVVLPPGTSPLVKSLSRPKRREGIKGGLI
jgi:signal transduction histidine kinase